MISKSDLLPWITCYLHYLHANYLLAPYSFFLGGTESAVRFVGIFGATGGGRFFNFLQVHYLNMHKRILIGLV